MDWLRSARATFDPWLSYIEYCFNGDPLSPMCGPFWQRVILGVIAVGALAVGYGCWYYYQQRRKERQAAIAEWERAQVDFAGIKEKSWEGDKAFQADMPEEEMARRIREALDQRRAEQAATTKPA